MKEFIKNTYPYISFGTFILLIIGLYLVFNPQYNWLTFNSDRVQLSFKHPKNWPVSQCQGLDEPPLKSLNISEQINFERECIWDMRSTRFGSIIVKKTGKVDNPLNYIKNLNTSPFGSDYEATIEPTQIGNKTGFVSFLKAIKNVIPRHPMSKEKIYYVFANNMIYEIHLSDLSYLGIKKDSTEKTFNKVLTTFRF